MDGRCAPDHEPMGFGGRVGDRMFASKYERVISDMLILDKALTGRYLPLAITFISEELFSTFDRLVPRVGR
jgi:lysine--8-amino-7-oxononanoate aminotransferase